MKLYGTNNEQIINSKGVQVYEEDILKDNSLFEIHHNKRGVSLGFSIKRDFKIVKNGTTLILIPKDAEVYDFEEEIILEGEEWRKTREPEKTSKKISL